MKELTAAEKQRARVLAAALRQEIDELGLTVNQFALTHGEKHGLRQTTLSGVVRGRGASQSTLDRIAAALSDATGRMVTAASLMALRDDAPGEPLKRPSPNRIESDSCLQALRSLPWDELVRIAPDGMRVLLDAVEGVVAPPLRKVQILLDSERSKSGVGLGAFAKARGLDPELMELIANGASAEVISATWPEVVAISKAVRDFGGRYGNLSLFCLALFEGEGVERISKMVGAYMAAEGLANATQLLGNLLAANEVDATRLAAAERKELMNGLNLILRAESGVHDKAVASALGLLATAMGFEGSVEKLIGTAQQISS